MLNMMKVCKRLEVGRMLLGERGVRRWESWSLESVLMSARSVISVFRMWSIWTVGSGRVPF